MDGNSGTKWIKNKFFSIFFSFPLSLAYLTALITSKLIFLLCFDLG